MFQLRRPHQKHISDYTEHQNGLETPVGLSVGWVERSSRNPTQYTNATTG